MTNYFTSPKTGDTYELRYDTADYGERKPRHIITAHAPDGSKVGEMQWYGTTGVIHRIDVNDEHSRRGLATAMWDHANSLPRVKKPKHSGDQTAHGQAWAKSVGGRGSRGAPR